MNIEADIKHFISDYLLRGHPDREIRDDESLVQRGVIDSMAILQLSAYLEDRFSVTVDDADFTVSDFESVSAISSLVRRKLRRH